MRRRMILRYLADHHQMCSRVKCIIYEQSRTRAHLNLGLHIFLSIALLL